MTQVTDTHLIAYMGMHEERILLRHIRDIVRFDFPVRYCAYVTDKQSNMKPDIDFYYISEENYLKIITQYPDLKIINHEEIFKGVK